MSLCLRETHRTRTKGGSVDPALPHLLLAAQSSVQCAGPGRGSGPSVCLRVLYTLLPEQDSPESGQAPTVRLSLALAW